MAARLVAVLLVLIVLAVAANDALRITAAQEHLRKVTDEVAKFAGENLMQYPRDQAASQVADRAWQNGVTVYMYDQNESVVKVWTQSEVVGTIAAGTIANLIEGKSFSEAQTAPFIIRSYREGGFARQ
jgi:hypothetical protein